MEPPPRLLTNYFKMLTMVAQHHLQTFKTLLAVGQMVAPPGQLFAPRVAGRVLVPMLHDAASCGGGGTTAVNVHGGGEEVGKANGKQQAANVTQVPAN